MNSKENKKQRIELFNNKKIYNNYKKRKTI